MRTEEKGVKERLLASAKEEFLAYGFRNSSLRRICAGAGVTTGAVYFFFRNKEELFSCLVERPLAAYEEIIQCAVGSNWEDTASALQNEERIIRFLLKYRDECRLVLEKSEGTRYAGFYEQYKMRVEKICTAFFEKNVPGRVNPNLVKLLVNMRLQSYLELIRGDITLEEGVQLTKYMASYADAGFARLINVLNNEREQA